MRNGIFKYAIGYLLPVGLLYLVGCAILEPVSPKEVLSHPLGTSMLRVGLTKDKVIAQWGNPDVKETGKWGNAKEKWTYYGRYNNLPADVGYLSKTQYLYFDGDYLVKFSE